MIPHSRFCSLVFFLSALYLLGSAGRAETVTVGDPAHPADLPKALYQAHDSGAKDITISAGIYQLPEMGNKDSLLFDGWTDTAIHATGATLIFSELKGRPVRFRRCTNVTWDGGTLLFVHPSFTQGRITEMGKEDAGFYCDWQIDAGYPTDMDANKVTYNVVDQKTRLIKVDTGDWSPTQAELKGPGLYRMHYPASRAAKFAVGDWLVTRAPGGSTILHLDGSGSCTIKNVVLQNAGFAAFFETGGEGGNHYLNCQLQPGPLPTGATEPQLVGCGADGFHSVETATGPDIEDCVFTGVFLDDCIAIHGSFDRVIKAEDNTITLGSAHKMPKVGDPIRIADMKGFFAQANCANVVRGEGTQVELTLDQALEIPIDHSEDGDKRKGTKSSDPRFCGQGYKILRCRLGDTRSRGILVKSDRGIISECKIEGCGMSGISIGPEFWWGEAGYCWDVEVTNNTLLNCNKNNRNQAPVWIHGDGAMGNRNIAIRGNRFDSCYGESMIRGEWTDGLEIIDNTISHAFEVEIPGRGNVIRLEQCKNVKLLNNKVSAPGPFAGELVEMKSGMTGVDISNNDSNGIKISP